MQAAESLEKRTKPNNERTNPQFILSPLNNQKSMLLHKGQPNTLHPAVYYCGISSPQKHQHFHLFQQHQPQDTQEGLQTHSTVTHCSTFCQPILTDESVHSVKRAQHEWSNSGMDGQPHKVGPCWKNFLSDLGHLVSFLLVAWSK